MLLLSVSSLEVVTIRHTLIHLLHKVRCIRLDLLWLEEFVWLLEVALVLDMKLLNKWENMVLVLLLWDEEKNIWIKQLVH